MIKYIHGNLLEAQVEALVNTVNEAGVMGKGIALMFKDAFPENTHQYVSACKTGSVKVGKVFVTSNNALVGPKWIINFPTKKHWRNPSRLEWIRDGLEDLAVVILAKGIRSIAIPPLGCGNGGLDWSAVRPMIESALSGIPDLDVRIYAPISHYLNAPKHDGVEALTAPRAMIAELMRRYSILGMECSMLEVQKLAWFLDRALDSVRIPNPLNLEFVPNRYGPYADRLRHLLDAMDGSFLRSEKRIADAKAFDPVYFNESRREEVSEFLGREENKGFLEALEVSSKRIEGFESPLGMELLATVDWILHREGVEPNRAAVKKAIASWPAGTESAQRKLKLFDDDMIGFAINRLVNSGP
jgi:O-acetyl-ADP-ribose deacetylase (regulator of RNase III)